MESQFGIANVWTQGDFVTRFVAVLLLVMSLASWIVILVKALDIMKFSKNARTAQAFWHSEDFATGLLKLGPDPSNPFRQLALEGREATAHHRNTQSQLHDTLDVSDWVTRCLRNCLDEFTARLQLGLAILASVGSTVPNRPINGAVEPTEAKMAKPNCSRAVNSSKQLRRLRVTQSLTSRVSCN